MAEPFSLTVRNSYVAAFTAAVEEGRRIPLVFPYSYLGTFFVPVLYLSIPHTKRPWLYKARWAVMAGIVAFNAKLVSETSSTNMACAYATGLMGWWGIMVAMNLLVWTAPQFEAERVVKVRVTRSEGEGGKKGANAGEKEGGMMANGAAKELGRKETTGLKANGECVKSNGHLNGHANGSAKVNGRATHGHVPKAKDDVSGSENAMICRGEEGYEYLWESYPEDGSFLARLNWAADLVTNFRGTGWNWSIDSIPRPPLPEKPLSGSPANLVMPLRSRAGYTIDTDAKSFLRNRLALYALNYFILDALSTFITKDPFFVLGPNTRPRPPILHELHPLTLAFGRSIVVLGSVYWAVIMIMNTFDLYQYFIAGYFIPARRDAWVYPSPFGGFNNVFDRGLAGFWGGWWHQTFRVPFTAPATWMVKNGYLKARSTEAKLAAMGFAFLNSAILHMCGSWTSAPSTKWWRPLIFFSLSALGIFVQQALCHALKPTIEKMPRLVRRVSNLLFVFGWMELTCWPMANDFGSTGLWLFEPVPVSFFRGVGFGCEGEGWWRLDAGHQMRWVWGRHWWESGWGG